MDLDYILHPTAQEEYEDSVYWYRQRSVTTAQRFVKEVEEAFDSICTNPNLYEAKQHGFREVNLSNFPFTIVFKFNDAAFVITIIAIYHQNRDPRYKYR